ncbi:uncharacterized protein [Choristoneura fumiferana]|uniref:uncharacterized protein n=1 Tax=Choristoneura fumiferana TaxID=7141 RepID=UPI003D15B831
MVSSSLFGIVVGILCLFDTVTSTNEYIYEFGSKRGGEQVYDKEGEIGLLTLYTTVQVRVPKNTRISYIKVNVHAISSPKVDFDEQTNTVSIKYSWTQITLSSYRIFAKGVHE